MIPTSKFREVLEQKLETEKIPVIRTTSLRLIELLGSMLTPVEMVTETILRDQGFTAQILKLANSAYFSRGKTISNVSKAVVNIGYSGLRDITLTVEYADLVQRRLPKRVQLGRILAKAFVAARWASAIGQEAQLQGNETLFTAALLESLGDLAVAAYLPEIYQKIESTAQSQGWSYQQAHAEVTEMSPHDVTAIVCWSYNLPEHLVLARPGPEIKSKWPEKEHHMRIGHFANDLAYNLLSWPYPEILGDCADLFSQTTLGLDLSAETIQISLALEYQKALKLGATIKLDPSCFSFQKTRPEDSDRNSFLGLCQSAQLAEV
ncbi:MAG: HDOD domain-containing protein [Nitrospirota bacterium]